MLTFGLVLGGERADSDEKQQQFYDELLQRIRRIPGVHSAGATLTLPLSGDDTDTAAWLEGQPAPKPSESEGLEVITPGYLRTLGVPILAGRDITAADVASSPLSVLVNESFVRKHHLTAASAVDRRLRLSSDPRAELWTIVGVVGDVKFFGPARPPKSEVLAPSAQRTFGFMSFVVRAEGDPMRIGPAVRAAVAAIDPTQPVTDFDTLQAMLDATTARTRFLARLLSGFGALALLLAAIGIYGVMNWSVVERRREIGVRMAVGAPGGAIAAMVLRQGGVLLLVGLVIGAAAATALTHVLSGLLFEVHPGDPLTYAVTVGVLSCVALVALWLPAHRAARVDPVAVLHE